MIAFRRLAQALAKHPKGDMLVASGRLDRNWWTSKRSAEYVGE